MIHSEFPAHVTGNRIQTVTEHCRGSAERACSMLSPIHLGESAYLAGLIHDMGKCKREFAEYLAAVESVTPKSVGSVNHTFAAVRYLLECFHTDGGELTFRDIACELIAYAAGAHHGLFDITDELHGN